jgi:ribose transport system permease protein
MTHSTTGTDAADFPLQRGNRHAVRRPRRRPPTEFLAIWVATGLLFAIGGLLASESVSSSALLSMLPFAAVLAIASVGQTLVAQQGGLDLSTGASISLGAAIVTKFAVGHPDRVVMAVILAVAATAAAGFVVGLVVSRLGVSPLVATLAMGSLLLGAVQQVTGGFQAEAQASLNRVVADKTLGIPNTVIFAAVVVALVALLVNRTVAGRRFVLVGANPSAAVVAGIAVRRYEAGAYAAAGACYGLAGVLLGAFVRTPGIAVGDTYLLSSVAAVVLGGTSLAGGRGSVVATAIGAIFIAQLNQLVLLLGAESSLQLIIQGLIIAAGMAIRTTGAGGQVRQLVARARSSGGPPHGPPGLVAAAAEAPPAGGELKANLIRDPTPAPREVQ